MKIGILVGALVVGGVGLYLMPDPYTQNIDPFTSSSIPQSDTREYAVANLSSGEACIVKRGAALTNNSKAFDAARECDSVWNGLSSAATWLEQDGGLVVLADHSGKALMSLAPADGVAFESLEPVGAELSFSIVR